MQKRLWLRIAMFVALLVFLTCADYRPANAKIFGTGVIINIEKR